MKEEQLKDEVQADAGPSLSELIREQAREDEETLSKNNLSLRHIIGGDILTATVVRKQIWLVLLITFFLILYIAQGYSYKNNVIEIDRLTNKLKDAKYRALSTKSDLTEHTRESKILEMLRLNNDSLLKISDKPPFMVEVPVE